MPLRTLKPLGARACRTGCLAPPIRQPKVSVAARVRIDAVAVALAVDLVELAGHPDRLVDDPDLDQCCAN